MAIYRPRLACTVKALKQLPRRWNNLKIKGNQIQKTTTKCHELKSREAEYTNKYQMHI